MTRIIDANLRKNGKNRWWLPGTDPDVANMSDWGLIFATDAPLFHGDWDVFQPQPDWDTVTIETNRTHNTWNYIDFQRAVERDFNRTPGVPHNEETPLFWDTWESFTYSFHLEDGVDENRNLALARDGNREPIADWEWHLAETVPPIFAQVCTEHNRNPFDPFDTGV